MKKTGNVYVRSITRSVVSNCLLAIAEAKGILLSITVDPFERDVHENMRYFVTYVAENEVEWEK